MKIVRIMQAVLVAGSILLNSQDGLFAQEDSIEISQADIVALIGDTSIIDQSKAITDEASRLVDEINADDQADKTKYITKIRTVRVKMTKRSPLLRTLIDNLRSTRDSIARISNLTSLGVNRSGAFSAFSADGVDIQEELDLLKIDIDAARASNSNDPDIKRKETKVAALERQLQAEIQAKEQAKRSFDDWNKSIQEERQQRAMKISRLDEVISSANKVSTNLDEVLNLLDDASGSILQADAASGDYTNQSTIFFSVLVGLVIIGFFGIAFYSKEVRDTIFTSESGIQFVTLFSLVIAIILFGVLKILEGKELAALLGGLSGYILGRGSDRVKSVTRAEASQPEQPSAGQPAKP